jgi:hypothetical protein
MLRFFLLLFIFVSNNVISQDFSAGYKAGWPIGYCYYAQYGCIAPLTPLTPLPKIGESSTNFWDGYNRGLADGIMKGRLDLRQKNETNVNPYQSYSIPQYIPKYEPFTPDFNFYNQALSTLQNNYNQANNSQNNQSSVVEQEIVNWVKNYSSIEEKEKRMKLMSYIFSQSKSYINYPEKIPDGIYKAYYVNDTKYYVGSIAIQNDDCEIRNVCVQNNKIIYLDYQHNLKYNEYDVSVFFDNEYNKKNNTITISSSEIVNGVCWVTNSIFNRNTDPSFTKAIEEGSKQGRYYFIDYLSKFDEAQLVLEKIKLKYVNANKSQKISDGWHVCYLTDRKDFCEIRNVYVLGNKITKWITGDGQEAYVDTGGEITQLKSTFSRKLPPQMENENEEKKLFWRNTFLVKPTFQIFDAYFVKL